MATIGVMLFNYNQNSRINNMKKSISNFILEKFGLSAELTMNIFTTLSITTGITVSYEWVIQQNYFWITLWAIASVTTIASASGLTLKVNSQDIIVPESKK